MTAHVLDELSDAELARQVVSARAGEALAEEAALCRRFAARVRLYGLRHLRDEQLAADLVQRVLLLTIEKLRAGQVREPERIASFVLGSSRMVSRELRRGRREQGDEALDQLAGVDAAPEPLGRAELARCLAELPERERSVLLLTFYQEQDAREIARALAISEGNVRVIRHRALERLRACMRIDREVMP